MGGGLRALGAGWVPLLVQALVAHVVFHHPMEENREKWLKRLKYSGLGLEILGLGTARQHRTSRKSPQNRA